VRPDAASSHRDHGLFAVTLDEARAPIRAFGHRRLLVVFLFGADRLDDLVGPRV